jgi:hypothetical protein
VRRVRGRHGQTKQRKAGRTRRVLAGSGAMCHGLIGRGLARQARLGLACFDAVRHGRNGTVRRGLIRRGMATSGLTG